MPRYYFDVEDGGLTADEDGEVLDTPDKVAPKAMRALLDIARFEVMQKNERQLSVSVRDEAGVQVYRAELTVRAGWVIGTRQSEA